jgi:hypothetical protein
MRVFLSWSGESSRDLARCLHGWLKLVLQAVEPFFSEESLSPGSPWLTELLTNLQKQDFFVACVTRESLDSAWFNFEAGIAAGALFAADEREKSVCPVLFELEEAEVPQPLGMFQMVKANEQGIRRLVGRLNEKLDRKLAESALDATFARWWPDLERCLAEIDSSPAVSQERPQAELLNEILLTVRQGSVNSAAALAELTSLSARLRRNPPWARPSGREATLDELLASAALGNEAGSTDDATGNTFSKGLLDIMLKTYKPTATDKKLDDPTS